MGLSQKPASRGSPGLNPPIQRRRVHPRRQTTASSQHPDDLEEHLHRELSADGGRSVRACWLVRSFIDRSRPLGDIMRGQADRNGVYER